MKKFLASLTGRVVVFTILAISGSAQTPPVHSSSIAKTTGKTTTRAEVAPSDAVITIRGLCSIPKHSGQDAKTCTMEVTRDQFEQLVNSMNVLDKTLGPETLRKLAEVYAEYLALEQPAVDAGLEKTARFDEIMRWWRLRTLAGLYRGSLQEQFRNPSTEEIHAYYVSHLSSYDRIKVARILIPHWPNETMQQKQSEDKALEVANSARDRVLKGEDMEVVERDSYSKLGLTSRPPITDLGMYPRSSFPPAEVPELFALGPGQVSKVENEGSSYVVYKVWSKVRLSEDSVHNEIALQIAQDKYDNVIHSIDERVKPEYNDAYFGRRETTSAAGHTAAENPHP